MWTHVVLNINKQIVYFYIFMLGISFSHTDEVLWMPFSLVDHEGWEETDLSKSGAEHLSLWS